MGRSIALLLLVAFFLSSCGEQSQQDDVTDKVEITKASLITQKSWCEIKSSTTDVTAVVKRYEFKNDLGNKKSVSRSGLIYNHTGNTSTYALPYPNKREQSWYLGKSPDEKGRYAIQYYDDPSSEEISGYVKEQNKLNNKLRLQLRNFNFIFEPSEAIKVEEFLLQNYTSTKILFPCDSYAGDFTTKENLRSSFEYWIIGGQNISLQSRYSDYISKTPYISSKLELINPSLSALEKNSWCNWDNFGDIRDSRVIDLKIITFKGDHYINSKLQLFSYKTADRQIEDFGKKMSNDHVSGYKVENQTISTVRSRPNGFYVNDLLMVKDKLDDKKILINHFNDIVFEFSQDYFFNCERMKHRYPRFVEELQDQLIRLHNEKLDKAIIN